MDYDKRRLHHFWKMLRYFSAWYFLIIALVFAVISVNAMRNNNLEMIKLRDKVAVADEVNGNVEIAIKNLRMYVYGHMNTNLDSGNNPIKPPIQLKFRYSRLVQAEKERVSTEQSKIYTDAQLFCQAQYPGSFSGGPRVPCITTYVTSHTATPRVIDSSLYKFDFVSPAWSPDLAGWSLVVASVSAFLFVAKFLLDRWLKSELNT
jgi:hypothetical protein